MSLNSVLYVEDEPDIQQIVKMLLTKSDIEVFDFDSGESAIEAAQELSFDMMILDLMLKEIDGVSTLEKIRSFDKHKDVPCVFLTAKVDRKTLSDIDKIDNVGIVYKPFNLNTFLDELQRQKARLSPSN